jgi:beta-lactamase regulating signal transducer with metallopeptidase domain
MSAFNLTLLWCALQATAIALITSLLCLRPWRLGGASTPFVGLCAIVVLTIAAFVPLPMWLTPESVLDLAFDRSNELSMNANGSLDSSEGSDRAEPIDTVPTPKVPKANANDPFEFGTAWLQEFRRASAVEENVNQVSRTPNYLACFLFAGVAFGLARLLIGWIATRLLLRQSETVSEPQLDELMVSLCAEFSIRTPVRVFVSNKLTTAATLGAIKPVILLPKHWRSWSPDEIRAVLAHELAHVRHRDFAAQLLSQIGVVLHFYNPLVHWLSTQLRLEQEIAADFAAARVAGGSQLYVKLLAKLALDHENQTVGWPARAFLPTGQTLLRRLEMLKRSKMIRSGNGPWGRWISWSLIGLGAIVLIGIRPGSKIAVAQSETVKSSATATATPYNLNYLSKDSGILVMARPSELLKEPRVSSVLDSALQLGNLLPVFSSLGIEPKDIDEVVAGANSSDDGSTSNLQGLNSLYLRTSKPLVHIQKLVGENTARKAGEPRIFDLPGSMCAWLKDDTTLIVNSRYNIDRFVQGGTVGNRLLESSVWKQVQNQPILVLVDGAVTRTFLKEIRKFPNTVGMSILSMTAPIMDETDFFALSVSMGEQLKIEALSQCGDASGAKVVKENVLASIVFLKNGLRELRLAFAAQGISSRQKIANDSSETVIQPKQIAEEMMSLGSNLLDSSNVQVDGAVTKWAVQLDASAIRLDLITQGATAARVAAQRTQSVNNLKQIGLAFHNYHSAYTKFPNSQNSKGKFPCSWRVAILPFIEQAELYQEYNFDEPWDSPSNMKLLPKMPSIYRHPDAPAGSTATNYVVVSGPEMIFGNTTEPKLQTITDGTSNTILAVEAESSIPWTKPEDFAYETKGPLPKFGGFSKEGYNVVFGDGSVHFFSKSLDEKLLRNRLTPRGGELDTGL